MVWDGYKLSAPESTKARDLDETRRLLYMAMYAGKTKRYELVGTLVNALAHHGAGVDPTESGPEILAVVDADDADTSWLREKVQEITAILEAES